MSYLPVLEDSLTACKDRAYGVMVEIPNDILTQ